MNSEDINDKRTIKEFKGITLGKFKKSDVIKELIIAMQNSNIEAALNWSAELICSGHFIDLWDTIILYMSKNIHLGNPKLPIYVNMRFNIFKEILNNGYVGNELLMRNNGKIRSLFTEVIYVLSTSKQKAPLNAIKITTKDFDMAYMKGKLKAPKNTYVEEYLMKEDPRELYIALNELCYYIDQDKDYLMAAYWLEWILLFDFECKKK